MKKLALALVFTSVGSVALAQQSASFNMTEHVFNSGGRPEGGSAVASASHRITLDAVGDSITPGTLTSGSFQLGGGFVTVYPPPGETHGLRFQDDVTLSWAPEPSAGTYSLYRGALASLAGLAYGGCRASAIAGTTTTDPDNASVGQGFFYLVTAKNLLAEEGVKGYAGNGSLRPNPAPCP